LNGLSDYLLSIAQVVAIDLSLAGDNLILVGLAASRVSPNLRQKVILWGIAGAAGIRAAFAVVILQILPILGLTFAGGLLLLSVCWRLYRDLAVGSSHDMEETTTPRAKEIDFRRAISNIIVADLSMSLDNILAVAGAARDNAFILVSGILFSIGIVAFGANTLAKVIERYTWVGWLGLALIFYVAIDMIIRGFGQFRSFW
jgi:YjbE family integral membrane protein